MSINQSYTSTPGVRHLSFEVLPPLKGNGTDALYHTIDILKEFDPLHINITTHHSEYVYTELPNGLLERHRVRRRPGTIAIAAAIQRKFGIPVIPHIICSGTTVEATEYELLDLQFLGISRLLLLRGDKAADEKRFSPTAGGHSHTTDLIAQVNRFNEGFFADGSPIRRPGEPFTFGVACYPEKHEEAPNLEQDMAHLKTKQDMGAQYAITQMFFDNRHYYDFVSRARQMGITIPIIPGVKPITKCSQLTVVPKTFHCDLPEELASQLLRCKSDDDARLLGIEWATEQCRDLYAHDVPRVHFYTMGAVESVRAIANRLL